MSVSVVLYARCNTGFCWLCGKDIGTDTFPTHFASWNTSGCAGKQFEGEMDLTLHLEPWERCVSSLFGCKGLVSLID